MADFLKAFDISEALNRGMDAERTASSDASYCSPDNTRNSICNIKGCNRLSYAKHLCNAHYIRNRKDQRMDIPIRSRKRNDTCMECGDVTQAKGGWNRCVNCYKKRRRSLIKELLIELFGGECTACGIIGPSCIYDFHHVESKTDAPGNLIDNASVDRIAEELSKCILLCANCHREIHYG